MKNKIQESIRRNDEKYQLVANDQGRSSVWNNFSLIECDGKRVNYVCCNKCKLVFSYTVKTGTGILNRHKCALQSTEQQPTLTTFMTKKVPQRALNDLALKQLGFVAKDLQPLSVTEGELCKCVSKNNSKIVKF